MMTKGLGARIAVGLALGMAGALVAGVPTSAQTQKPAANTAPAKPAEAAKPTATQPAEAAKPAAAQPAPTPAAAAPAETGWAVSCAGASRAAAANCAADQRIVARETGQLISGISVRVAGDTRQPVVVVQAPFGLYLPGGLRLQVDQGPAIDLAIETCEPAGCYAIAPSPAALITAMSAGQVLDVSGQTVSKEPFRISHPISGFKAAFDAIR